MGGIRRRRWGHGACAAWVAGILALSSSAQETSALPLTGQEPAQRPIVRAVRVVGNVRYTPEQIAAAFGQQVGEPLMGEAEVRRGVEVLFDTFRVRTLIELLPHAANEHEVELLLRVDELPLDLELRIVGNVEIDDDEVREWAGIGESEELYLYQAPRIRARLLQRYREEGYYFAEVKVVERPAGTDPETGEPT